MVPSYEPHAPFVRLLVVLAALALGPSGCSPGVPAHSGRATHCPIDMAPGDDGPRILFIGNSLTYGFDVPGLLASMFHSSGVPFEHIASCALPDYGLPDHWQAPDTRRVLAEGWDLVILQQGPSATEGRPYLLEYAQKFADEVRRGGGVPALLMVWPAEVRAFEFDAVHASYAMAAERVDGYLFPAGMAWRAAWARDAELTLYGPDRFHASPLGSLLTAMTIFEGLNGAASGSAARTFCIEGHGALEVSPELHALLEAAAAGANAEFGRVPGR